MGWHFAVDHTFVGHIQTCTDKVIKPNFFHIFPQTAQKKTYHCFCLCWFNPVKEMLLTLVSLCALVAMSITLSENM